MKRQNYFFSLLISFLAFVLVFLWFKDGYIMGTAEGIIPFYNLGRYFDQVNLAWANNNPGLGMANGIITAYGPTYWVLSLLEKIGIAGFLIEALVFWFLFTISGLSVYFLGKVLFPKLEGKYLLIGSLFYWFNFISLVSVWNRFLFNYMFFWAFLPLGAAIFILGLDRRKYIYSFFLGLLSVVFSLSFSSPVFNFLFWFLLSFITAFWVLFKGKFREKIFFLKFLAVCLAIFIVLHSWWLGQVFIYVNSGNYEINKEIYLDAATSHANFSSLSKSQGELVYLFRLMHGPFFTKPIVNWASMYNNILSQSVEFLLVGICLFNLIKFRKNISILFLSSGLFMIIILTKGNSPPLGEVIDFLFKRFSLLHFFRNPFEKFGLLLPVFFSPLLSFAIYNVVSRLGVKLGRVAFILFTLLVGIYFGYPYLSGLIFTHVAPPTDNLNIGYKVKVPDYYMEASSWLENQGNNFRLLGLPFRDQGITYNWEKGYQGVEPASVLFSTPNIMYNTTVPYYSNVVEQLEPLMVNSVNFSKVLNILNIRYSMVREDVDFRERNMRNPEDFNRLLTEGEDKENYLKLKDFNKLRLWENALWHDYTFYTSNDILNVSPQANIENITLGEFSQDSVLMTKGEDDLSGLVSNLIIYPQSIADDPDLNFSTQEFKLAEEGEYEILINNLEISKEQLPLDFKQLTIDNNNLVLDKFREDGRISFGTISLSPGVHNLTVPIIKLQNSINTNGSFELNKNSRKVMVDNFNPFAEYLLEFNYFSNNNFKIRINQDTDQIRAGQNLSSYERVLPQVAATSSAFFKDLFLPRYTSSLIELEFQGEAAKVRIKDLAVRKVFKPRVLLVKNKNKVINSVKPQITYFKSSPTKYTVSVRSANSSYVLVFSELYNPGWEVKLTNGEILGKHFLVNAYANGWLIDKTGDYDLVVEFAPQRLLNFGIIISILAFGGGILYIIIKLGNYLIIRFKGKDLQN